MAREFAREAELPLDEAQVAPYLRILKVCLCLWLDRDTGRTPWPPILAFSRWALGMWLRVSCQSVCGSLSASVSGATPRYRPRYRPHPYLGILMVGIGCVVAAVDYWVGGSEYIFVEIFFPSN